MYSSEEIDQAARKIWEYMLLHQPLKKCDAIFVLGSRDERVASYGAELFLKGYGDWLIFSGGSAHHGDLLRVRWQGGATEAEHFASIAMSMGVPQARILLETKAANTGENIRFTYQLLQDKHLILRSFLLVQKPYMERRAYATFKKQWPGESVDIVVASPPIAYENYFDGLNPKDDVLNIMVGDLQRIKDYPKLGFQIEQTIPSDVWQAWEFLASQGYDKHILKNAA